MAVELHLAEHAVALHLFLQYFESLVDIVVADEDLQMRTSHGAEGASHISMLHFGSMCRICP